MTFILTILPVMAIMALLMQHSHLLMTLLILESLTLSLVLLVPFLLMHSNMSLNSLSIMILCLGACEASVGLSLLVLLSRSSGSDLITSLSTNKC